MPRRLSIFSNRLSCYKYKDNLKKYDSFDFLEGHGKYGIKNKKWYNSFSFKVNRCVGQNFWSKALYFYNYDFLFLNEWRGLNWNKSRNFSLLYCTAIPVSRSRRMLGFVSSWFPNEFQANQSSFFITLNHCKPGKMFILTHLNR